MRKRRWLLVFIGVFSALFIGWVLWPENNQHQKDRENALSLFGKFKGLCTAIDAFEMEIGRFPSTPEGIHLLIECPANIPKERWRGPYVGKIKDPWGRDFRYLLTPDKKHGWEYEVISAGKDGRFDTEDDIANYFTELPHYYDYHDDSFLKKIHDSLNETIFPPVKGRT